MLLTRQGSIRGRKLHVFNTIRMMRIKSQWQRDYTQEEANKVVVYITTCGILRRVWERCRDTVELLKALKIKAEFRDLNIDPSYADELADRMRLDKSDRELVYDGLPMVYVNGKYFGLRFHKNGLFRMPTTQRSQWAPNLDDICTQTGYQLNQFARKVELLGHLIPANIIMSNDSTLMEENENKNLVDILRDFQGRQECATCNGSGYTVCSYCRGGKKAQETFRVRLRCARCDRNGIAHCPNCSPVKDQLF